MTALNKTSFKLLTGIVASMADGQLGYKMATKKEAKALIDAELVEFNDAMSDGDKVAFRATPTGVEAANGPAPESTQGAVAPEGGFALETGFEPEAVKRLSGKQAVYPFEKMEIGVSFFVPATEARPNPAKSLASTISSANKRYDGERTFVVRPVETPTKGARVYRVAQPAPAAPQA